MKLVLALWGVLALAGMVCSATVEYLKVTVVDSSKYDMAISWKLSGSAKVTRNFTVDSAGFNELVSIWSNPYADFKKKVYTVANSAETVNTGPIPLPGDGSFTLNVAATTITLTVTAPTALPAAPNDTDAANTLGVAGATLTAKKSATVLASMTFPGTDITSVINWDAEKDIFLYASATGATNIKDGSTTVAADDSVHSVSVHGTHTLRFSVSGTKLSLVCHGRKQVDNAVTTVVKAIAPAVSVGLGVYLLSVLMSHIFCMVDREGYSQGKLATMFPARYLPGYASADGEDNLEDGDYGSDIEEDGYDGSQDATGEPGARTSRSGRQGGKRTGASATYGGEENVEEGEGTPDSGVASPVVVMALAFALPWLL